MDFLLKYRLWALSLLSILLYANTLGHGFVMDDMVVLTQNTTVQKGMAGVAQLFREDSFAGYLQQQGIQEGIITGGRYRPFSLAVFALGVSVWGNSPVWFHLLNLLLFLGCVLVFYHLVLRLSNHTRLAFVAAILFAVHPIHTEVVANIKSADELWGFLLGGTAVLLCLGPNFDWKRGFAVLVLFLSALLAKEIALIWVLLLPIALWYVGKQAPKILLVTCAMPLVAVLLYAGLRFSAIESVQEGSMMHEPMNNTWIHLSGKWTKTAQSPTDPIDEAPQFQGENRLFTATERHATAAYTLWRYAQLMALPYPLSHDYSPYYFRVKNWTSQGAWAGLLLAMVSTLVAISYSIPRRRLEGLAIIWFWLPLLPVLNLFFPVGAQLAERFLMLPSAGFCLLLGMAVVWLYTQKGALVWPIVGIVVAIFTLITLVRNRDWVSNEQLLKSAIVHTPQCARPYLAYGDLKLREVLAIPDTAQRNEELRVLENIFKHGLELHPYSFLGWHGLGAIHYNLADYPSAIFDYQVAQAIAPTDALTKQNLTASIRSQGVHLLEIGEKTDAAKYLNKAYALSPDSTILPLLEQTK